MQLPDVRKQVNNLRRKSLFDTVWNLNELWSTISLFCTWKINHLILSNCYCTFISRSRWNVSPWFLYVLHNCKKISIRAKNERSHYITNTSLSGSSLHKKMKKKRVPNWQCFSSFEEWMKILWGNWTEINPKSDQFRIVPSAASYRPFAWRLSIRLTLGTLLQINLKVIQKSIFLYQVNCFSPNFYDITRLGVWVFFVSDCTLYTMRTQNLYFFTNLNNPSDFS